MQAFQKIHIPSGDQNTLSFELTEYDLKLLDTNMNWVVESDTFTVLARASSDDIRIESQFEINNDIHLSTVE